MSKLSVALSSTCVLLGLLACAATPAGGAAAQDP